MLHPDTELRHTRLGQGVFATDLIPAGTVTWVLDPLDVRLTDDQVAALPLGPAQAVAHFAFRRGGVRIVCWDHAKYLNHSCRPTCLGAAWGYEVAVRDIQAGEELTTDYSTFFEPGEFMSCHCRSPDCRGRISRRDEGRDASPTIGDGPQPLLALVPLTQPT